MNAFDHLIEQREASNISSQAIHKLPTTAPDKELMDFNKPAPNQKPRLEYKTMDETGAFRLLARMMIDENIQPHHFNSENDPEACRVEEDVKKHNQYQSTAKAHLQLAEKLMDCLAEDGDNWMLARGPYAALTDIINCWHKYDFPTWQRHEEKLLTTLCKLTTDTLKQGACDTALQERLSNGYGAHSIFDEAALLVDFIDEYDAMDKTEGSTSFVEGAPQPRNKPEFHEPFCEYWFYCSGSRRKTIPQKTNRSLFGTPSSGNKITLDHSQQPWLDPNSFDLATDDSTLWLDPCPIRPAY